VADIDECASGQAICPLNSECINFIGGAECRCLPGYQLKNGKCRGNTNIKQTQQRQRQKTTKQAKQQQKNTTKHHNKTEQDKTNHNTTNTTKHNEKTKQQHITKQNNTRQVTLITS